MIFTTIVYLFPEIKNVKISKIEYKIPYKTPINIIFMFPCKTFTDKHISTSFSKNTIYVQYKVLLFQYNFSR